MNFHSLKHRKLVDFSVNQQTLWNAPGTVCVITPEQHGAVDAGPGLGSRAETLAGSTWRLCGQAASQDTPAECGRPADGAELPGRSTTCLIVWLPTPSV